MNIQGTRSSCPLCQSELVTQSSQEDALFPVLPPMKHPDYLILKIMAFISIIIAIVCIFINVMLPTQVRWSLFIVVTLACAWISLAVAIFKHKNILKYLLYQSVIITIFSVFIDILTGWYSWSITFVVPSIFTLAMLVMFILSKVLHLHTGDYMIYLLLDALFCIIPIIFVLNNLVITNLPSIICIFTSIISLTAIIIFEGQKMYSELNRRFHV
ncbi:MAG: DUF6320 domain-containing protein [Cellulosilyticaceae bacterium]